MKLNKEQAEKVWFAYFGDSFEALDPFGTIIYRFKHGLEESGGWEVDHIWPLKPEKLPQGANIFENVQPLAHKNNGDKSNLLQGKSNSIPFAVHKNKTTEQGIIGRIAIFRDGNWYWGYNEPRY